MRRIFKVLALCVEVFAVGEAFSVHGTVRAGWLLIVCMAALCLLCNPFK